MRIRHFFLRLSGSGCARVLEISWLLLLAAASPLRSQAPQSATLSRAVLPYVRVHTPRVVLEHVRVIDGTGTAAQDDRNIVVEVIKSPPLNRVPRFAGGFGDQREIELLVEAGFTPVEAIKIGTFNGAVYLGQQERIGSIAVGKDADLVVIKGDPATHIADIENVEIVFK